MPNTLASIFPTSGGSPMGPIIIQILAVGLGGGLGAIARFVVGVAARGMPLLPPYAATLTVNVIGCFGIGIAFTTLSHASTPGWVRAMLMTGVLGAFTTFSTFSLESLHLMERRAWGHLAINVSASVVLGFLAVWLGFMTATRFFPAMPSEPQVAADTETSNRDT